MRAYYADNLRDDPAFDTVANRYGYALALVKTREAAAAAAELKKLVARDPSSSALRLALANAEDQAGNKAKLKKNAGQLNPARRPLPVARCQLRQ